MKPFHKLVAAGYDLDYSSTKKVAVLTAEKVAFGLAVVSSVLTLVALCYLGYEWMTACDNLVCEAKAVFGY